MDAYPIKRMSGSAYTGTKSAYEVAVRKMEIKAHLSDPDYPYRIGYVEGFGGFAKGTSYATMYADEKQSMYDMGWEDGKNDFDNLLYGDELGN